MLPEEIDRHGQSDDDDVLTTTSSSGDETGTETGTEQGSDETVVQQLKNKLAAQGRELKAKDEALTTLTQKTTELIEQMKAQSAPKPNGDLDISTYLEGLAGEDATVEDLGKAVNSFLRDSLAQQETKLRQEFRTQAKELETGQRENTVLNHAKDFFRSKGVEQLAQRGSDFYLFLRERANAGDAIVGSVWSAAESAPEWAFSTLWPIYLKDRGIKDRKPPTRDEHMDSVLYDEPSSQVSVGKDAQELVRAAREKKGSDLEMEEIDALFRQKGIYKQRR